MTCSALVLSDATLPSIPLRWRWRDLWGDRIRDYCHYDRDGTRIGTVVAAAMRPTGGRTAPTVLLRR